MLYSFIFDFDQLDRAQDRQDRGVLRIIHTLLDDRNHCDQYIVLIDCSEQEAVILSLL